jgi:hypothetical protein
MASIFEVDWGHFGALDYSGDRRKLYAFALIGGRTRWPPGSFSSAPSRLRARIRLLSAAPASLAAGREKGKVERAIGYTRKICWPLRQFADLDDVNRQARQWPSEVAN